jgi:hypothetical protein
MILISILMSLKLKLLKYSKNFIAIFWLAISNTWKKLAEDLLLLFAKETSKVEKLLDGNINTRNFLTVAMQFSMQDKWIKYQVSHTLLTLKR